MPPSGVDYASEFLNGYAPEYVNIITAKYSVMTTITDQTEYLVTAQAAQELQHLIATRYSEALEVETI